MSATLGINEAFQLITDVRQGQRTIYDSFPEVEQSRYNQLNPEEMIILFGNRYRHYLAHVIAREKIRLACEIAVNCQNSLSPAEQIFVRELAALSMGSNYCMELTSAAWLKSFAMQRPLTRLSVASSSEDEIHAFLISGDPIQIQAAYDRAKRIDDFFSELQNCIILDPYLNTVFPAENFNTSALKQYFISVGLNRLINMEQLPLSPHAKEHYERLKKQEETVKAEAMQILQQPSCTNERITWIQEVLKNLS